MPKKIFFDPNIIVDLIYADNKLNNEYVLFDPTGQQAMPAFTNAQRLGIGAPVIDVIRAVIKINKQQAPPPKKQTKKTPTHPGL